MQFKCVFRFRFDFLTIYDGSSSLSTPLVALTGYNLPNQLTSSGRELFIRFESDDIVTEIGFNISTTERKEHLFVTQVRIKYMSYGTSIMEWLKNIYKINYV